MLRNVIGKPVRGMYFYGRESEQRKIWQDHCWKQLAADGAPLRQKIISDLSPLRTCPQRQVIYQWLQLNRNSTISKLQGTLFAFLFNNYFILKAVRHARLGFWYWNIE